MVVTSEYLTYGLYAIAYVASLAAFVMTNITWLRIWVILSSTCYAIYYYVFPVEPLWLDVITEAGLVLLNIVMLGWIALSALTARFDDTAQFLYDSEFSALSRHDFRTLLNSGEWCNIGPGYVFTARGEPVEYLYYLIKGEVVAALSEALALKRRDGNVIGEISFRSGGPASATVTAATPCLVMRWRQRELRELCKRNTEIDRAINELIASHMARKLTTN